MDNRKIYEKRFPKCHKTETCFARKDGKCTILRSAYKKKEVCPFRKEYMEITRGKYFKFIPREWGKDYEKE